MIPDEVIIRAGTNMFAHTDMVPLEYVRQLEQQLKQEKARLDWLESQGLIGIDHIGYGDYRHYAGEKPFKSVRELCDEQIALRGE